MSTLRTDTLQTLDSAFQVDIEDLVAGNSLLQDITNTSDATKGAAKVGYKRSPLTATISNVQQMLSAQHVNVWEYANLVTVKPNPADPNTWDWTPAVQAAANYLADANFYPTTGSLALLFPAGRQYKVTSVEFGSKVNVFAAGAVIRPFNNAATLSHLLKFTGFNRVYDLTIDMEYALNYDTAIWMRGRHSHFFGCSIWKARYAWQFGDPAWANDPAQGHLGDSENILHGCETIWCITAVKAFGLNTILHFNDCLMYTYRNAMQEQDPTNPNLATWNSLPERTFINTGTLIYLNGGVVANFTGFSPVFYSQLQPVTDPAYKNSFGRFFANGTHIESGYLFQCAPIGAFPATDTTTRVLDLRGCNGFMPTTAGHRIDLGGDCQQSVWVDACNFYGQTGNNILYSAAGTAEVYVDPKSFNNITIDFFEAFHGLRPFNYESFCAANVISTAQTITTSASNIIMPTRDKSDVWTTTEPSWYSTSTGIFSPRSNMRNVKFDVSLLYPAGVATDATTYILLVNGVQQDIAISFGSNPRAVLKATRIAAGATVTITAQCTTSRAAGGTASNRLTITGAV